MTERNESALQLVRNSIVGPLDVDGVSTVVSIDADGTKRVPLGGDNEWIIRNTSVLVEDGSPADNPSVGASITHVLENVTCHVNGSVVVLPGPFNVELIGAALDGIDPMSPFPFELPPTVDPVASVTIQMVKRSNTRTAPEGFSFELDLAGFDDNTLADRTLSDPSFINPDVYWDFNDDYEYEAIENAVSEADKFSRYTTGPISAHTYRTPGDKVVTVWVHEPSSGKWAFGEFRIGGTNEDTPAISDPDVVFAGDKTIHVDPTGVHADAKAGSILRTSLLDARNYGVATAGDHRIELARGQSHPVTSGLIWRVGAGVGGMLLCADAGSGAKPELDLSGYTGTVPVFQDESVRNENQGGLPITPRDFRFCDIVARGGWDPVTETGERYNLMLRTLNRADYMQMEGCDFSGFEIVIQNTFVAVATDPAVFINDTAITDWRNFGGLFSGNDTVFATGTRTTQNVDAGNGGQTTEDFNAHGGFRFASTPMLFMHSCDGFSANGHNNIGVVVTDNQPVWRFNTSPAPGDRSVVRKCVAEGGFEVIHFNDTDGSMSTSGMNSDVSHNVFLGSWATFRAISTHRSGLKFSNNTVIIPDTERDNSPYGGANADPLTFFIVHKSIYESDIATRDANRAGPIIVRNNTFVNLMSVANSVNGAGAIPMTEVRVDVEFTGVDFGDNVVHQPNLSTPVDGGSFILGSLPIVPRSKGYRKPKEDPTDPHGLVPEFATPADTAKRYIPTGTNPAIGADANPPQTDFSGAPRPTPSEAGAFQAL